MMNIRPVREADLAAVISLMIDFAAHEGLSEYCEITTARLHAAMFGNDAFVEGLIVQADGDDIAGYALFFPSFSSFRGHRGLYLEDIYIKDEFRGRGIGRAVLAEIAKIAVDRGFDRIDFLVLDGNESAIKFYTGLGAECDAGASHFKFTDDAFRSLAS